jgi:hypothetical protein
LYCFFISAGHFDSSYFPFLLQVMVSVSRVIAVLVPDAVHAMQDMCRMQ